MLLYHHSRLLESVRYGEIAANPAYSDPDFKDAYRWLEKEIGFYPLFLAVGINEDDLRMTGYQNNWRRFIGTEIEDGKLVRKYRRGGEFSNEVLFSFEHVDGIFMDYDYWHIALNAAGDRDTITDYEKRLIFKPSWRKTRWLNKAKYDPHSVQLAAPRLHLPAASLIRVRNKSTQLMLEMRGFQNIEVRRIRVENSRGPLISE